MTDIFANGPSAPHGGAPSTAPQAGDVTGTLAELERKLRELERELTSIGRRRELAGASVPVETPPVGTAEASGRIVDEAIEPPAPSEPAGSGQPVKFVRPLESTRQAALREPPRRNQTPAVSQPQGVGAPQSVGAAESVDAPEGPSAPGERVRPSEAQLASLAELRRFRDRLERLAKDLASEYDALLGRVMTGLTSASPPADQPPPEAPPGAPPTLAQPVVPPMPPPPPTPPSPEEALFEGRVELGVGPFYDIASLSAFERRLAGLPHVAEASVRRFEASHAVVDVRLAAPVALVLELRRAGETDFNVREVADGRILLTFDDG
jgi:hypothetical protein